MVASAAEYRGHSPTVAGAPPSVETTELSDAHKELEWSAGLLGGVDFEGEVEAVFAVEGADYAGLGADTVGVCPELVVGVLGEVAKAEVSAIVRDVGANGVGVRVLEVDDGPCDGVSGLVDDLAFGDSLDGSSLLRKGRCAEESRQDTEGSECEGNGKSQVEAEAAIIRLLHQ